MILPNDVHESERTDSFFAVRPNLENLDSLERAVSDLLPLKSEGAAAACWELYLAVEKSLKVYFTSNTRHAAASLSASSPGTFTTASNVCSRCATLAIAAGSASTRPAGITKQ